MAARRCSVCGIDYPSTVNRCEVCGGANSYMGSVDVDPNWQLEVETRLMGSVTTADARIHMWRLEYALSLGFPAETAESLAISDADMHLLERLVKAACPLELAARIV